MVTANISGSEMSLDGFLLAENGVGPIAAVAAWVEGTGPTSSDYLKGPKMAEVVGLAHWQQIQQHIRNVDLPGIPRDPGTLQIDELIVIPGAR